MQPRSSNRLITLAVGLCIAGINLGAQEPAAAEDSTQTVKHRSFSTGVAAALAASMPKYDPPKPAEKKPEEEDVDLRDVDKPRNQIIRLPEYVVQEKKPPVFRERDIYTTKGLAELAKRRYLSQSVQALNRYTIPLFGMSAEAYAMMLYAEDERLENISELNASADDVGLVDPENARQIREATRDTYQRGFDYTYRKKP
jgi:hypothetical protein|uniref:hypothetical protein n=1 Tax=Cephaloticoccus sp. TaxID=1985742 RepID=UPI004048EAF9